MDRHTTSAYNALVWRRALKTNAYTLILTQKYRHRLAVKKSISDIASVISA